MMGGRLEVRSQLGVGSRFWFDLDLMPAEWNEVPSATSGRNVIGYGGERCRVLITDDSIGNRTVLSDLLTPLGFIVQETENGLQAVEVTPSFSVA